MEADLMAYDFTTAYIPYELDFREYPMHEMMNDQMEYVRRPWQRCDGGNICLVCSTVKRPSELVDGRASRDHAVICLRCAIPSCEKCGDTAWAWELLQGGFQPPYRAGEWAYFDLECYYKDFQVGPEGNPLPDEISASLLRQLCLQGISWESFRNLALKQHVSPSSQMLCPPCKRERSCRRCEKRLREVDFDRDSQGYLYKVCRACQHLTCSICGATRGSIWTPNPMVKKPVPLCDVCESKRTCSQCGRLLDVDYLVVEEIRYKYPFFMKKEIE